MTSIVVEQLAERASDKFWAVVAAEFPDITTGDFGPGETHAWMTACETAITTWVHNNVPWVEVGQTWRLRRDVDRRPHFVARAGSLGTVVDARASDVELRMHARVPGAEEWDNCVIWSQEDDPYYVTAVRAFALDAELVESPNNTRRTP